MFPILVIGGFILKIISLGTLKGGTGKSMMSFNIAGALAEDYKVLLLDVDPQCNLSNNVGINIAQQDIYTIKDIFDNPNVNPNTLVVKCPIPQLPNLDIIPGHIQLTATELLLSSKPARERILEYYIEDNREFFSSYDYIIIDTNPSMGLINQNAFCASDSIILVSDIDDNSRIGLELFIYLWDEVRKALRKEDNVKALLINKLDIRTSLSSDMIEYISGDSDLSKLMLSQPVRARVAFPKAAMERLPVTKYKGAEQSSEEIKLVIKELFERGIL